VSGVRQDRTMVATRQKRTARHLGASNTNPIETACSGLPVGKTEVDRDAPLTTNALFRYPRTPLWQQPLQRFAMPGTGPTSWIGIGA
jgi:hypothetical protein